MIVWAGIRFLYSRGNPTEVTAAKKILQYAIVGLAIILIGSGFVTLIESILNLGAEQTPTPRPTSTTPLPTNKKGPGLSCIYSSECASGKCVYDPNSSDLGGKCQ